ncbi:PREDICTED: taste receptor type 2 member 9-like [Nanorana parkeri]|uniref:taste receptor type 2 member 9-like n=1 Tax=Nanorana parkeri TaxID=125878 RepID=UPI000854CD82|nr:PREDICTED: taste receptor type 2 member 9-like [Nanorana parkeri]
MTDPYSISSLISVLLGLGLAIPFNTCIVIVHLKVIRKKGKLSPSDVIFMAKGMVNVLLQGFMTVQGMLFVFSREVVYTRDVYSFLSAPVYSLTYFSFWMTFWLSAHYCTNITHLSYGFFIWLKGIVSNFLSQILFLTALAMFIVNAPCSFYLQEESGLQSSENITKAPIKTLRVIFPCLVPVTFLGCFLPFCLSLLCLLLTFSFLVRHVWRVKNNDSGSSRPNLQAHVTALRTIFFLLLIFVLFCISQALRFISKSGQLGYSISMVGWNLRILSPSLETAVIFQASNKLKSIILRRFWTRRWRNTET